MASITVSELFESRLKNRLVKLACQGGKNPLIVLTNADSPLNWTHYDFLTLCTFAKQTNPNDNLMISLMSVFGAHNELKKYYRDLATSKNHVNVWYVYLSIFNSVKNIKNQTNIVNDLVLFLLPNSPTRCCLVQNFLKTTYQEIIMLFNEIQNNIGQILRNTFVNLTKQITILCQMLEILEDLALVRAQQIKNFRISKI